MDRKVDPAALLIAVIAVGISPLLSVGPWDPMNTVVAGVVGAILLAFTWPRKANLRDESGKIHSPDPWRVGAQALVYGLIIAIGSAWIVQLFWKVPSCDRYNPTVANCMEADKISRWATWWALCIGGGAAIILGICMWIWIRRLRRPTPRPAPPGPSPANKALVLLLVIFSLFSRRSAPTKQSPGQRKEEAAIY